MAKMLFNPSRAVDLLVCFADVDPARFGAIGHSLGAKEVLYLSALALHRGGLAVWKLTGAPQAVGLLNHRQGHAFPPIA